HFRRLGLGRRGRYSTGRAGSRIASIEASARTRFGHRLDSSRMRNWNQVSQLKLFDSCQGTLADDERGRITYTPEFVHAETAQAWFTELRSEVTWRSERREMYDREVDVPRLLGHFRLVDPTPGATPAAIQEAARRVVA